ncbi:expressed unknown protein [Seminavis robusta]|uniref:Uncharacterized protein n=1 Tax=Seminavis robusta TaxID=568900 RepID=A0A9N8EEC9_9STRA|nr:expressed unknown protein [Seminavis robusta]|eukprot:Sro815_g206540.1 n/a (259) ;mRNA; r:33100-33876
MSVFSSVIVNLNNQALLHLQHGQIDQTVGTLCRALSTVQHVQDLEASLNNEANKPMGPQNVQSLLQSMASTLNRPETGAVASTSPANGSNTPSLISIPFSPPPSPPSNSILPLFSRALTIATPGSSGHAEPLLAMLLFNMGLTMHLEALKRGDADTKGEAICGALELYEMAFSVVEDYWEHFQVPDLLLVVFALLNNMGHIHSSRFDQAQTEVCLNWLNSLSGMPMFQSLMNQPSYRSHYLDLLVTLRQQNHACSPAA